MGKGRHVFGRGNVFRDWLLVGGDANNPWVLPIEDWSKDFWLQCECQEGNKMFKLKPDMIKMNEVIDNRGDNVVELKLATGGDEPPFHPNDWLSPLADGTIFLFNDKKNPFDPNLGQAKILSRTEKAIYLGFIVSGQPMQGPVDPLRFCTKYSKYEILGTILNEEQEHEEARNGERDRLHGDPGGSSDPLAVHETLQGMPDGPPKT